jgi:hypothetical protein
MAIGEVDVARVSTRTRDVQDPGSAEASYYTWVDWFDTFGLGRNVPIAMGNLNSSILALVDGKFVNITLPYSHGVLRPRTSTDASTIRMPAGRARRCGRRMGPGQCFTSRAARRTGRRPSRSSFVRIRSRGDCVVRNLKQPEPVRRGAARIAKYHWFAQRSSINLGVTR